MNLKSKFISQLSQFILSICMLYFIASCQTVKIADTNQQASTSIKAVSETISTGISTDNLNKSDAHNGKSNGNGSGDLVFVIYDPSGNSPRKKSLLIDLSYIDKQTGFNDLTLNDILKIKKTITIPNQDLSEFINESKDPKKLQWKIFAIANHYNTNGLLILPDFINYGILISTKSRPKKALEFQDIHQARALHSNLIKENNRYGIDSNGSLISFTGEPSAFDPLLYSYAGEDTLSIAAISEDMKLSMQRIVNSASTGKIKTSYQILGKVKLKQTNNKQNWHIIFTPH